MQIHDAFAARLLELADERNKTVAEIAKAGGLRQSTVSEIMQGRSKHPRLNTIQMYCNGCGISLPEFFDSDLFRVVDLPEQKK